MHGRDELLSGFAFLLILDVLIMHSPVYLAICTASLGSMLLFGTPELISIVFIAALAIAVLGVPHGGLDHWTGRRLLQRRFATGWWAVFFPAYLFVGSVFALGWFLAPTMTVILFFLVSAWHFGREDQQSNHNDLSTSRINRAIDHVVAASVGGLVIWIPALIRPDEMQSLLSLIVPTTGIEPAIRIVEVTQIIAACFVPLAAFIVITRMVTSPLKCNRWVPLATAAIATCMPILISFSIYFCGWHSWQGLQRLRRDECLATSEFVRCVAPLSVAAIIGVVAAGWWLQDSSNVRLAEGQVSALLRTVFIGLSAIAVPHLFLHELDSMLVRPRPNNEVYA